MNGKAQGFNYKGHWTERSNFGPENSLFHGQLMLRAMNASNRPSTRNPKLFMCSIQEELGVEVLRYIAHIAPSFSLHLCSLFRNGIHGMLWLDMAK